MSKLDDGGPAFPRAGYYPPTEPHMDIDHLREMLPTVTEPQTGLSLRDYFAAAALTGLLAWSPPNAGADTDDDVCGNTPPHQAVEWAYQYADAMLRARAAG